MTKDKNPSRIEKDRVSGFSHSASDFMPHKARRGPHWPTQSACDGRIMTKDICVKRTARGPEVNLQKLAEDGNFRAAGRHEGGGRHAVIVSVISVQLLNSCHPKVYFLLTVQGEVRDKLKHFVTRYVFTL